MISAPSHIKKIVAGGKSLTQARRVLIMLHGRGATAESILSFASHLKTDDFALLAPQATNNTWYPCSFLAAPAENEPWLSSALSWLSEMVSHLITQGFTKENIYFFGFSQGASLTLEFVSRNASRYGGIAAFTGGLIGDRIYPEKYSGNFDGTPIVLGTSDRDQHVPLARVQATAKILESMHASVTLNTYAFMGHTINQDEIDTANRLVFGSGI